MLNMMSKPLADLVAEDIAQLVGEPENQYLDFKVSLSSKDAAGDPWVQGKNDIGDRAKRELAISVVAFANADGGWVVLGMRETGDHPKRGKEIAPLRECHELAKRLQQSISERIDPYPLGFEARGIETGPEAGWGVVVLRMPASNYAPHGVVSEKARESYIRRNDECRLMTMRDVQERTLEVARGLAGMEQTLAERRAAFAALHLLEDSPTIVGMRISALPTRGGLKLDRPWRYREHFIVHSGFYAMYSEQQKYAVHSMLSRTGVNYRPGLRCAKAAYSHGKEAYGIAIYESGLVDSYWKVGDRGQGDGNAFAIGWLIGDVLNVLNLVDKVRSLAGAPDAEYAMEVEIHCVMRPSPNPFVSLIPIGGYSFDRAQVPAPVRFPLYRVGPRSEFPEIALDVMNDARNAGGWQSDDELIIEFDGA